MALTTTRDGVSNLRYQDIMKKAQLVGFTPTSERDVYLTSSKRKAREAAIMAPTPKEQRDALVKLMGQKGSTKYTGQPVSPDRDLAQKMSLLIERLRKRQKEMNIDAPPHKGIS